VNGDSTNGSQTVWLNVGNGFPNFSSVPGFSLAGSAVALADFNGDGKLDAYVGVSNGVDGLYLGNGSGGFTLVQSTGAFQTYDVAAGDVTGDGRPDVVIASGNGQSRVLRYDTATGQLVSADTFLEGYSTRGVAVGDLDKNGSVDIVVAAFSGPNGFDNAHVLLNQGGGVFASTGERIGPYSAHHVALGNLDAPAAPNVLKVLANDTDADGDTLTVSGLGTSSIGATLTISADGKSVIYDATSLAAVIGLARGQSLQDTFQYTVSDGHGGFDSATATVNIPGVNDAPKITQLAGATAGSAISVAENTTGSFITVTATDAEHQTLTYSIGANPDGTYDNNFFTINPTTGALSFISPPDYEFPDPGNDHLYKVQVTVTDTQGATEQRDYFVKVTDVNENTVLMDFEGVQVSQGYAEDGLWVNGYNGFNGSAGQSHIHWQDFAGGNSAVWGHSGGTDLVRISKVNGSTFDLLELDILVNSGVSGLVGSNGAAVTISSTGHYSFGSTFDNVTFVDLITNGNHGASNYSSGQTTMDNLLWV
jgi:VCBS repeat-containing protein